MATEVPRQVDILLVEDNPADVVLAREALGEAALPSTVHVVEDGASAISFLHRQGQYAQSPRPTLILLDLNLPRKSGREVLAEIKLDPALRSIPVVILTTSSAEDDIRRSYDLHANCYIVKPYDYYSFVDAIQSIRHFWFSVATLPAESAA
jgi:two-component system, chemotaxis family, response regulator Rcp1